VFIDGNSPFAAASVVAQLVRPLVPAAVVVFALNIGPVVFGAVGKRRFVGRDLGSALWTASKQFVLVAALIEVGAWLIVWVSDAVK